MSWTSSRASSPLDLNVTEPCIDQIRELDAKWIRHPKYYFEDGNSVFQVEDTLYNVHRYFFARDSAHFRAILQGTDDDQPYMLSGVKCADFDEFLAILYPTDFRRPAKKTTAQWISVLHLAAEWGFENIKLLAIDNLTATATPIDKIVLGRRYSITDWLPGAYEAVCTRADPLNLEEGMKLGVEDTVRISAARQVYGTCSARYETEHLAGDLGDIFSLVKSSDGACSSIDGEENVINILEGQAVEVLVEYLSSSTQTGQGGSNMQCGNYSSVGELTPNQKKMRKMKLQKEKEEAERPMKEREEAERVIKEREEAERVMKKREAAERDMKEREQEEQEREQAERVQNEEEAERPRKERMLQKRIMLKEKVLAKQAERIKNEKEEAERVRDEKMWQKRIRKEKVLAEREREEAEWGMKLSLRG